MTRLIGTLVRTITIGAVLLAATACGDDDGGDEPADGETTGTTSHAASGGTAVLGVEQWPECINMVTCGSTSAAWWSVLGHVLPKAMIPDLDGNYVASPLLVEAPSLDNGGVTTDPFTISYQINPDANWSDGTPITSADFDFTWRAIMNTPSAYSTSGYAEIESIDTSDPKTAVVTFSAPYVAWHELWGGTDWGVLEAAAFPELADSPTPDLGDVMQDEIPFSGGPWILESWSTQEAVLVRNPNYYGTVASLDQLTMVPFDNTNTEIQALLSGQVDAIQPQVGNASVVDQIGDRDGIGVVTGSGLLFEALWFNVSKPPLDDPLVREALMYAVDRQALVDAVVSINNPDAEVVNCGLVAFPGIGPWCDNVQPFSEFDYDPAHAVQLLESAGYDCSDAATGPCAKDGQPLVLPFSTTVEDTRRTTGQQLIKERMVGTGFDVDIQNHPAGVLFSDVVPTGQFTLTEYARGSYDPSVTGFLACESVPSEANEFGGGNWNFWCDEEATDLMHRADQALDLEERAELMGQIYAIEAEQYISLPLYVLPEVGAFRSDRLSGPVGDYLGNLLGMYYNANEWVYVG